ncbi:MAG: endo-1,4-beta-xylanase Z, partial [Bacteroidales bacterium]|nr:endo-1,4-beta-xylanase Z [Bacteroidales bacterium]
MKKVIVLTVALAALLLSSAAFAQPQRRLSPNDTLQSVRVLPDGTTIFSIYAPKARTVSLTGDAVPWGQPLVPVEKDGVWSFRVPNVKPGA